MNRVVSSRSYCSVVLVPSSWSVALLVPFRTSLQHSTIVLVFVVVVVGGGDHG